MAKNVYERLDALRAAAEESQYLPHEVREKISALVATAEQRRQLSAEHTVVGFFGATGSGKTTLFNAVVGEDLGVSSPRRPTTSSPLAAVWEPAGAEELLDWLQVEDRRPREGQFSHKSGPVILLDLPDFDSVEPVHREIATRLAGQVDVLVWVTDPEKYADSIIHNDFIRPHALHSEVTLAVLNKADKLADADRGPVADSLAALLREDGLRNVSVIPTSAKTGMGVDELRAAITKVAAKHAATSARVAADIDSIIAGWAGAPAPGKLRKDAKKQLDAALVEAAGAPVVADATAAAYRKRLGLKTGWVLTAWMLKLRPDPLRRLGLEDKADTAGVHRSSMPELDAAHKAVANRAVRAYAAQAAEGLPVAWESALSDAAAGITDTLPEELDRAVTRTFLPAEPSGAWNVVTLLQWLALVAALVGVLWYVAVAFLPGALTPLLGEDLTPEVEGWPIPTLLILAGILLGIVLGLLGAAFGGMIGAAVRTRTRRALKREVAAASASAVEAPLAGVRDDYARFLRAIEAAKR